MYITNNLFILSTQKIEKNHNRKILLKNIDIEHFFLFILTLSLTVHSTVY